MTSAGIALELPLAHLLHWYFMPIYAAPIVLILYTAIRDTVRQRRGEPPPVSSSDARRRGARGRSTRSP
jgi:hypothetical protein